MDKRANQSDVDPVEFIKSSPLQAYKKGEILIRENETPDNLLAIQRGFVKVTALSDDGTERLLWIAGRLDVVPSEALFSRGRAVRFFYTAYTDVAAYSVDKERFLDLARSNLTVMSEIAYAMSGHYDDLLGRVHSIEQSAVRGKVIHTLHGLARRFSVDDNVDLYTLGLKLTHQDIADMVGATRETVSLELQKLRREGYIKYGQNKFTVCVTKLEPLIENNTSA
jgi:CRP/FNR family transcriptional regulator, anaerobic regulatory protein